MFFVENKGSNCLEDLAKPLVFIEAGFSVRLIEWWDCDAVFHTVPWRLEDGPIYRSSALDHRNAAYRAGTGAPGFTSLILDATRP